MQKVQQGIKKLIREIESRISEDSKRVSQLQSALQIISGNGHVEKKRKYTRKIKVADVVAEPIKLKRKYTKKKRKMSKAWLDAMAAGRRKYWRKIKRMAK